MTLIERFKNLTPEQLEGFGAVKDGEGLEAFLLQTGVEFSSEEKEQILEYIVSGKLPLSDEELESVAGGGCIDYKKEFSMEHFVTTPTQRLDPFTPLKLK